MKKPIQWSLLAASLLAFCTANAGQCVVHDGKGYVVHGVYKGQIECTNAIVDALKVEGALKGKQLVSKGALDVKGEAHLDNTVIEGNTTIFGFLESSNTVFEGPVDLHSAYATFTASKLASITVHSAKYERPTIVLDNSIVKGDVSFTNGRGLVILIGRSKVTGHVVGGKAEPQKK